MRINNEKKSIEKYKWKSNIPPPRPIRTPSLETATEPRITRSISTWSSIPAQKIKLFFSNNAN